MPQTRATHQPRKRFGQNFLRDESVIDAIAKAISPLASDHVVEIGPGEGALTSAMVGCGCRLDAIELDRDLTTRLLAAFSIYPGFRLHSADALKFDFASLAIDKDNETDTESQRLRIVGNLPYNISTPLIFKLLESVELIADMHFMLQKEVVDRLAATPGSKDWGRLGIMAQYDCDITHLFNVPPEAFYPPPKVQSAIVRLVPKTMEDRPDCDRAALAKVVQTAFAQRRKTLRNNFKGLLDDTALENVGIDPTARAETISLANYATLTREYGDDVL